MGALKRIKILLFCKSVQVIGRLDKDFEDLTMVKIKTFKTLIDC